MLPFFVGRDSEQRRLATLLESQVHRATSILLIEDESGQGKSSLIQKFKENCNTQSVPVSLIDLAIGSRNPLSILQSIRLDLRLLPLSRCDKALQMLGRPRSSRDDRNPLGQWLDILKDYFDDEEMRTLCFKLNVEYDDLPSHGKEGKARDLCEYLARHRRMPDLEKAIREYRPEIVIDTDTVGLSFNEQQQQWANGVEALCDDLMELANSSVLRNCVFLFDTFDKASTETKILITDHLLPMAIPNRVSCLVVVLAGKVVPKPTAEWGQHHDKLPLGPLQLQDWWKYTKLRGANLPYGSVKVLYNRFGSQPSEMVNRIGGFIPWR
jgi:hypothetical protein